MRIPRSAALGVPVALAAPAAAGAHDDASYWAFADRIQVRLNGSWDEAAGRYRAAGSDADTAFNASMLLTHSAAALAGHRGPARNDERARRLVEAFILPPAFVTRLPANTPPKSQRHTPGWTSSLTSAAAYQHVVFDAEIVEALMHAWLAREQLGLGPGTAAAIADRIRRVARGAFWRWPAIRLNQFNWHAQVYAADATVTGDPTLMRRDLRLQIERFAAGVRGAANGPSGCSTAASTSTIENRGGPAGSCPACCSGSKASRK
jgi:hypothetical protein